MRRPPARALSLLVLALSPLGACVDDDPATTGLATGPATDVAVVADVAADTTVASADALPDTTVASAETVPETSPPDGLAPDGTPVIVNPTPTPPTAIAATLEGTPTAPQIAVNTAGDALAVWIQQLNGTPAYAIYASRVTPAGWSAPTLVATSAASMPHDLALAQNARGDALVAWSTGGIFASRLSPGEDAWSAPFEVAPAPPAHPGGYVVGPGLTLDGRGAALVIWASGTYDGKETVLAARAQRTTGAWYPAVELARGDVALDASGNGAAFAVSANAAGHAVAAWATQVGTERQVFVRRASVADEPADPWHWQEPQRVSTAETRNGALWTAIDGDGTAFVAWAAAEPAGEDGETHWTVEGLHARDGAAFAAASTIATGIPASFGFESIAPELAADPSGTLFMAWREGLRPVDFANPEPSRILAKRYHPEHGWTETEVVADGLAPPYFGCAMSGMSAFATVLAGDTGAVVWQERGPDGKVVAVHLRTSEGGARWSETAVLGSGASSWSPDLSASLATHGGFALWTEAGPDPVTNDWTTTLWAAPLSPTAP